MRKLFAAAIALASLVPAAALAEPRNVDLVNRSALAIVALNVSPSSAGAWGPDILGSAAVPNGTTTRLRLAPVGAQCLADLRISFAGGNVSELRNVDLCHVSSITVDDAEDEEEEETVLTG